MAKSTSPTSEGRRGRRALFRATLGFGLVSVPVAVHRAITKKDVRFHAVHDEDGARIHLRAVCARDGAPVSREHIVKSFEIERGRHVQITRSELSALAPARSRRIEIEAFVDPAEIDLLLVDRGYYLAPGEGGARGYALLREAMRGRRVVAVARMVLRDRQRLVVVRPAGTEARPSAALSLTLLAHADELAPAATVPGLPGPEVILGDRELALAERLVDLHAARFTPERYHDEHRERVLAYLWQKAEGAVAAPAPAPAPPPEMSLVGALEASVEDAERHERAA